MVQATTSHCPNELQLNLLIEVGSFYWQLVSTYSIKCSLFPLSRRSHTFPKPPTFCTPTISTATRPPNMTIAWNTSFQITAFMPPFKTKENYTGDQHQRETKITIQQNQIISMVSNNMVQISMTLFSFIKMLTSIQDLLVLFFINHGNKGEQSHSKSHYLHLHCTCKIKWHHSMLTYNIIFIFNWQLIFLFIWYFVCKFRNYLLQSSTCTSIQKSTRAKF